jgi:hypothetical protein
MTPACPYCGEKAEKTTGAVIYPHLRQLARKVMYRCQPCEAWVGCHDGTDKPLGRLANAALRKAKQDAHAAFDPIWQELAASGMSRSRARSTSYAWLADALGIATRDCHIGLFDEDVCQRVVAVCKARTASA